MTTIHVESGASYLEQAGALARRPLFSAVRWGAIFAGVAVGVSMQLLLTVLGIASGLSTTDVTRGETVGTGPLIWAGISMLIAAFVGAYVAARVSGLKRKVDGILHGVVSWAVTTLMFAILATSAGGSLLSGVFSTLGAGGGTTMNGGSTLGNGLGGVLQRLGITNVTPEAMQTLQGHIRSGNREEAIQYMVGTMGLDQSRAATIVDQALILSGSPEQASVQSRTAADQAVDAASIAAWTVFLAVTISLALSVAGGAFGATGARRATWTHSPGSDQPATQSASRA
ncbi:MAG: hypothetical protein V4858_04520 [Pseudomonadota bacterium]